MRLLAPAVLILLLPLATAAAQQVEGRVLDAGSEEPVAGAIVALEDSAGQVLRQALADEQGSFRLWFAVPGRYRLSAERIGYAPVTGQAVRLDSGAVVQVEIRMEPRAVPVEPLRILARRQVERFTIDEFYDRMGRLGDKGTFITRAQIEASDARLPSTAVTLAPGTWADGGGFSHSIEVMSGGRWCRPQIYLNGRQLPAEAELDDWAAVEQIEGIEVYRGYFAPAHYDHDWDSYGCGFVLVWTRPEPDPRFAFTWERTILFGVLGGLVLGLPFLF